MKYVPVLDKGFRPMYAEFKKYSEEAAKTENKLLPIAWQTFAMPMARLCQRGGKTLPKA